MEKNVYNKGALRTILILWVTGIIISAIITKGSWNRYDAADYWNRGCSLWDNNKFSILNMKNGFRGYVYPLYLGICSRFGGKSGFIIINSLLNTLFMVLIIPRLHEYSKISGVRCIICYVAFDIFLIGLTLYSLSDLFAIVLCSISILLEKKLEECDNLKKCIGLSFFLGAVLYLTYNVRTIYMFADMIIVIKILRYLFRVKRKALSYMLILGGVCWAACLQLFLKYT